VNGTMHGLRSRSRSIKASSFDATDDVARALNASMNRPASSIDLNQAAARGQLVPWSWPPIRQIVLEPATKDPQASILPSVERERDACAGAPSEAIWLVVVTGAVAVKGPLRASQAVLL